MKIDKKLAKILSNFYADLAKAYFIGTFITPILNGISSLNEFAWILTKGLLSVILLLLIAWRFAKVDEV
ncbi:MAG: hypothetical protein AAB553_02745 [Patescibacteria group bacterium]